MASLVESGMKNLNFGDADSVGFFQMRVGIWNQGDYAGFPDKPELQVKWFLDKAEAVKKQRIAAGKPIDDPNQYGDWIADVERPAEQYRGRYRQARRGQGLLRAAEQRRRRRHGGGGGRAGRAAGQRAPAAVGRAAPQPAGQPIDPTQFGAEGTGGAPDAEALALLNNKNVVLDAAGIADIKAGRIDPRVVGVLTKLSHEHKITVSCMCSDHSKFTAGGSVSNHHFGRGVDIAAIDGEIVGPGSPLAREVASELSVARSRRSGRTRSARRWRSPAPATSPTPPTRTTCTSASSRRSPPDWKPPADVAASPAAAAAAAPGAPAAAVAPGRGAPPAPPPRAGTKHGSQAFLKAVDRQGRGGRGKRGDQSDSLAFLKAVEPPKAQAAAGAGRRRGRGRAAGAVARRGRGRRAGRRARSSLAPRRCRSPSADSGAHEIAGWMAGQARSAAGCRPAARDGLAGRVAGEDLKSSATRTRSAFFQMRVGIWNQGAYAGYPDEARAAGQVVPRPGRGGQAPAARRRQVGQHDPNQFGDWIADVERPRRAVPRPLPDSSSSRGQRRCSGRRRRARRAAGRPRRPAAGARVDAAAAAASAAAVGDAQAAAPRSSRRSQRGDRRTATRPARRRWRRSRRRRSTSAPTTSGAARRRRPASTARA